MFMHRTFYSEHIGTCHLGSSVVPPPARRKNQWATMASSSAASTANGAVSLLDLPIKSAVGIDGHIIAIETR